MHALDPCICPNENTRLGSCPRHGQTPSNVPPVTPERNDEGRAAEIEERLGKATPGPWEWTDDIGVNYRRDQIMKQALQAKPTDEQRRIIRERGKSVGYTTTGTDILFTGEMPLSAADANIIAHAPSDLRWALDVLAEKERELESVTTAMRALDEDAATAESSLAEARAENERLREALEHIAADDGGCQDTGRGHQGDLDCLTYYPKNPTTDWCQSCVAVAILAATTAATPRDEP